MMEYLFVLILAVLASLVIIIFELKKISGLLALRRNSETRQSEARENSPTINVNLGSLPVQQSRSRLGEASEKILPPDLDKATDAINLPASNPEPEAETKAPAKWTHLPAKSTPSGLNILKCPSCQAENSSYRTECFNCGKALR